MMGTKQQCERRKNRPSGAHVSVLNLAQIGGIDVKLLCELPLGQPKRRTCRLHDRCAVLLGCRLRGAVFDSRSLKAG